VLRQFRRHLAAGARAQGCRLSPRLGPGYLDWPLAEQRALFSVFEGEALPVDLNAYCVMMPKKSISGLFGLRRASLEVRRCGT
jgi:cobalamin-dependent methionine synthase I